MSPKKRYLCLVALGRYKCPYLFSMVCPHSVHFHFSKTSLPKENGTSHPFLHFGQEGNIFSIISPTFKDSSSIKHYRFLWYSSVCLNFFLIYYLFYFGYITQLPSVTLYATSFFFSQVSFFLSFAQSLLTFFC
jgi:hypothetical protein